MQKPLSHSSPHKSVQIVLRIKGVAISYVLFEINLLGIDPPNTMCENVDSFFRKRLCPILGLFKHIIVKWISEMIYYDVAMTYNLYG